MKTSEFTMNIQGINLLDIAERYGAPVYVYDAEVIKRQYDTLLNAFSDVNVKIKFACKALSNVNVMRLLRSFGSGLDTVS
ncbi:MAG TPA: diaminopimelate decarboxylase, partial [Candidatus Kapabacteria bacterium]|nr:diaminopimelate decarboxylase [Candidatus Kapabacteria bacterium]